MMHKKKSFQRGGAFLATVKKAEKKLLTPQELSTIHFHDGSLYQGQANKFGVFEGHGTYEL